MTEPDFVPVVDEDETEEKNDEKTSVSEKNGLECAICLQPYNLPVEISCGHVFCFLCIKGVCARNSRCPLCRRTIPAEYFYDPKLRNEETDGAKLSTAEALYTKCLDDRLDESTPLGAGNASGAVPVGSARNRNLDVTNNEESPSTSTAVAAAGSEKNSRTVWYYEGRNGWWRYDDRTLSLLEDAYSKNPDSTCVETMISGYIYVVDFRSMVQFRKDEPSRRRRVKREIVDENHCTVHAVVKGVAGLKLSNASAIAERKRNDD